MMVKFLTAGALLAGALGIYFMGFDALLVVIGVILGMVLSVGFDYAEIRAGAGVEQDDVRSAAPARRNG